LAREKFMRENPNAARWWIGGRGRGRGRGGRGRGGRNGRGGRGGTPGRGNSNSTTPSQHDHTSSEGATLRASFVIDGVTYVKNKLGHLVVARASQAVTASPSPNPTLPTSSVQPQSPNTLVSSTSNRVTFQDATSRLDAMREAALRGYQ